MAKQRIHIENLRIRLLRMNTGNARNIAGGFGCEIMKSIAEVLRGKTGEMCIDKLSATIKTAGGEPGIQKKAAGDISAEVKKRLG